MQEHIRSEAQYNKNVATFGTVIVLHECSNLLQCGAMAEST